MEEFDPAEMGEPMDFLDDFLDDSEPSELLDEEFLQQVESSPPKRPHDDRPHLHSIQFSTSNGNW